jgi:hypothetical protein
MIFHTFVEKRNNWIFFRWQHVCFVSAKLYITKSDGYVLSFSLYKMDTELNLEVGVKVRCFSASEFISWSETSQLFKNRRLSSINTVAIAV